MSKKTVSATPQLWRAELKIRHQVEAAGNRRKVTLACTPKAELRYALSDGASTTFTTNPPCAVPLRRAAGSR